MFEELKKKYDQKYGPRVEAWVNWLLLKAPVVQKHIGILTGFCWMIIKVCTLTLIIVSLVTLGLWCVLGYEVYASTDTIGKIAWAMIFIATTLVGGLTCATLWTVGAICGKVTFLAHKISSGLKAGTQLLDSKDGQKLHERVGTAVVTIVQEKVTGAIEKRLPFIGDKNKPKK